MRIGLMADTHDRVPAIAELVQQMQAAGVGMVLHAGDYCSPFSLEPFEEAHMSLAGVFGKNDGDTQGLRVARAAGVRRRAVRVAAQLRDRRQAHPARARHRRRARALGRRARDRGPRLHAPAGDEDARRHADRESGRGVRLAVRHAVGRDPRPRHADRWSSSTPGTRAARVERLDAVIHAQLASSFSNPDHRLRLAVHAAHRAAGARGARLLGDPSADAIASSGFASGSRRASSSAAARTPCTTTARRRPTRRCSTSRRCSASATACSSSRTSTAAR